MKILERVDLDRPILMHDKFHIIWNDNVRDRSNTSSNQECSERVVNSYHVKIAISQRKQNRMHLNLRQIKAYNNLLTYLDERQERSLVDKEKIPVRLRPEEKERQFLDALKIIIQSGYPIVEGDFRDILAFIDLAAIRASAKRQQTSNFMKKAAQELHFDDRIVDEVINVGID